MKKWIEKLKNEEGFTLIEMSIVLIIVALLLLLMVPNISGVMSNATSKTDDAIIQNVEAQIELYKAEKNKTVSSELTELVSDKYISEDQAKAYKEAKPRQDKTNETQE